ncbi:MAG TPA: cupin domain-containing protein [Burkholderiales bacterium]|nr:cupin domain-containing protein [Burkholderiales bacterium]
MLCTSRKPSSRRILGECDLTIDVILSRRLQMKTSCAKLIKLMPFIVGLLGASYVHAQQPPAAARDFKWVNAPASLPEGAKMAMLQGDLAKPGAFSFQLKLPAGYQLKPQSSPAINRLFVISGALNFGTGEKFDSARTVPLYSGYAHWPSNGSYFAFTKEETVVEIEGVGPWVVNYVNAADDPSAKRRVSSAAVR